MSFGNFPIRLRKIDWKAIDLTLFWSLARNPEKSSKFRRKKSKIRRRNWKKIGNSIFQSRKNVGDFWLKFQIDPNSNEYLFAKIGVDTDQNEPLEVWGENSIHSSFPSYVATALDAPAGRGWLRFFLARVRKRTSPRAQIEKSRQF